MSTGYSDETEPFRSPAWPSAKQTPQRAALQSRPTALRLGASRRALKAVQSVGLGKGGSLRLECGFPHQAQMALPLPPHLSFLHVGSLLIH